MSHKVSRKELKRRAEQNAEVARRYRNDAAEAQAWRDRVQRAFDEQEERYEKALYQAEIARDDAIATLKIRTEERDRARSHRDTLMNEKFVVVEGARICRNALVTITRMRNAADNKQVARAKELAAEALKAAK